MDKREISSLLISYDMTIKQALQRLNETSKKILFVIDKQKKLMGTLTDGDIRREIVNGIDFNETVIKLMKKEFVFLSSSMPDLKNKAKKLMIQKEIEQIPILSMDSKIEDVIFWIDVLENHSPYQQKKSFPNKVVIMSGGKGSRLDPVTRILPKPLIPIGNKPVIEVIMEKFHKYGFNKFIYSLNYKKEYVKLFLMENEFTYDINWVEEAEFFGTAGSLSLLKDKVKESFFVINCDSLLDVDYEEVLKWHRKQAAMITVIGCHNEVKIPFGVLELIDGRVSQILEKPVHDMIINTGAYVMEPQVLSYIPEGKYMDMNEVITKVMENGKVTVYPIYDGWVDIGQWDGYNNYLAHMIKEAE